MHKRVPKGTDPNGTLFEKRYHWGLSPLVLFLFRDVAEDGQEVVKHHRDGGQLQTF